MKRSCFLEVTNNISELHRIQAYLDKLAGEWNIPSKSLFQINLAVEELVTNIINHGYTSDQHTITIMFSLQDDVVTIQIKDEGKYFNPVTLPKPDTSASLENRKIGGLGIHLVKSLMDTITYKRRKDTNIVTIAKKIGLNRES